MKALNLNRVYVTSGELTKGLNIFGDLCSKVMSIYALVSFIQSWVTNLLNLNGCTIQIIKITFVLHASEVARFVLRKTDETWFFKSI